MTDISPRSGSARIYLLDSTDRHLEVLRLESGEVCLHCPALVSASDAQQIANGILAVLSGQFDRAISESSLRFDLSRRTPRAAPNGAASSPDHQPSLGDL